MNRVVLDTNIIISAHLKDRGQEASFFQLALAGHLTMFVSEAILEEYELVLRRRKFALDTALIDTSLEAVRAVSTLVTPSQTIEIATDPDDNKFLECAEEADADYLVTGNKRHFPKSWGRALIVNARGLIEVITLELKR